MAILNVVKQFRVSEEQNQYIVQESKNLGIKESQFLRRIIDADRGIQVSRITMEQYQINKELIYEINRIGNNINQIAKNMNSYIYHETDKRELFVMMKNVEDLLADNLRKAEKQIY